MTDEMRESTCAEEGCDEVATRTNSRGLPVCFGHWAEEGENEAKEECHDEG